MADREHPTEVKRHTGGEKGQMVDPGGDILQGAWPAAARLAHPPVLEVPDRVATLSQVGSERTHQLERVPRPPEAAVEQHDRRPARVSALAGRQPQLAEPGWAGAVGLDDGRLPHRPSLRLTRPNGPPRPATSNLSAGQDGSPDPSGPGTGD
jgi:hypothetical protein